MPCASLRYRSARLDDAGDSTKFRLKGWKLYLKKLQCSGSTNLTQAAENRGEKMSISTEEVSGAMDCGPFAGYLVHGGTNRGLATFPVVERRATAPEIMTSPIMPPACLSALLRPAARCPKRPTKPSWGPDSRGPFHGAQRVSKGAHAAEHRPLPFSLKSGPLT